jgi:hypothetical protein
MAVKFHHTTTGLTNEQADVQLVGWLAGPSSRCHSPCRVTPAACPPAGCYLLSPLSACPPSSTAPPPLLPLLPALQGHRFQRARLLRQHLLRRQRHGGAPQLLWRRRPRAQEAPGAHAQGKQAPTCLPRPPACLPRCTRLPACRPRTQRRAAWLTSPAPSCSAPRLSVPA